MNTNIYKSTITGCSLGLGLALVLFPLPGFAVHHAAQADAQCVLQVEKESQVVLLVNLNAPQPLSPLAYPLTKLGSVEPGDLVRVQKTKGVTLEITQKGDPACLKQVPEGDPHAHHRKNMTP